MSLHSSVAAVVAFGLLMAGARTVYAQAAATGSGQTYPNKGIRVVTTGVGGSNDLAARLIAQGVTESLGQPVIVDNRSAGFTIGEIVSRAPPDGYTLLVYGTPLWIGPLLQAVPSFDVVRDFSPISLINKAPNVLVVHPGLPVSSVRELIALAKTRPGELNYSVGGTGGASHLAGALFKFMTGINIVAVPYKSGAVETADLLGGQIQMTFGSAAQVSPHVKSGKLRGLAVTSAQPSALFPELPTIAVSGLPGYDAGVVTGILAPARTPVMVIRRLNQEVVRVLSRADTKERVFNAGGEATSNSPEEFALLIRSEIAKWGKLIKEAGIRAD